MVEKTDKKEKSAANVAHGNTAQSFQLAVVLVRGFARMDKDIADTLVMLKLNRKNTCVLVKNTPAMLGMFNKVKDFITWGEITPELVNELFQKRGLPYLGRLTDSHKKYTYKCYEFEGKKYYPYFYLGPPRKGFGSRGLKIAYAAGGALGYRKENINDLLKRMI